MNVRNTNNYLSIMNANFDYERSEISNNVKMPSFIYLSG